jgi:hypothetical protein
MMLSACSSQLAGDEVGTNEDITGHAATDQSAHRIRSPEKTRDLVPLCLFARGRPSAAQLDIPRERLI